MRTLKFIGLNGLCLLPLFLVTEWLCYLPFLSLLGLFLGSLLISGIVLILHLKLKTLVYTPLTLTTSLYFSMGYIVLNDALSFQKLSFFLLGFFVVVIGAFLVSQKFLRSFWGILTFLQVGALAYGFIPNATSSDVQTSNRETANIFYVTLDGYSSLDFIREIDSDLVKNFVGELSKRKFSTSEKTYVNYAATYLSIASQLRMDYVNDYSERIGIQSKDRTLPYQMIYDSKVSKTLENRGYLYYHDEQKGKLNPAAKKQGCNRIFYLPLRVANSFLFKSLEDYYGHVESQMVRCKFTRTPNILKSEKPVFGFIQIQVPHPPFLFDSNGKRVFRDHDKRKYIWSLKERYRKQIHFTNSEVLKMVDAIHKLDPKAVIILQGDHGSATSFGRLTSENYGGWDTPDSLMLKERHGAFYAIFNPWEKTNSVDQTAVNSFRALFNDLFDLGLELKEARIWYSSRRSPYNFRDVSDIVFERE
ncbi:MAG: hypothetical protein ACPGJV_12830 [Bacteriovoracaceae bacterium]